ncbi:hypothetical protein Tcan_12150 [Toxocara canis]|uniref:Uncharacterized protein n=1 Tax=Toxocara canis TaxID=6265 RepID=A0A0B2USF1_TOXCA|nr:hypothetical protein Tcan_12150 [Toxocara canis]
MKNRLLFLLLIAGITNAVFAQEVSKPRSVPTVSCLRIIDDFNRIQHQSECTANCGGVKECVEHCVAASKALGQVTTDAMNLEEQISRIRSIVMKIVASSPYGLRIVESLNLEQFFKCAVTTTQSASVEDPNSGGTCSDLGKLIQPPPLMEAFDGVCEKTKKCTTDDTSAMRDLLEVLWDLISRPFENQTRTLIVISDQIRDFIDHNPCRIGLLSFMNITDWGRMDQFLQCVQDIEEGNWQNITIPDTTDKCSTLETVLVQTSDGKIPLMEALNSVCQTQQMCDKSDELLNIALQKAVTSAVGNHKGPNQIKFLAQAMVMAMRRMVKSASKEYLGRLMGTNIGSWGSVKELFVCFEVCQTQQMCDKSDELLNIALQKAVTSAVGNHKGPNQIKFLAQAMVMAMRRMVKSASKEYLGRLMGTNIGSWGSVKELFVCFEGILGPTAAPPTVQPGDCNKMESMITKTPNGQAPLIEALDSVCRSGPTCGPLENAFVRRAKQAVQAIMDSDQTPQQKVEHVKQISSSLRPLLQSLPSDWVTHFEKVKIGNWGTILQLFDCAKSELLFICYAFKITAQQRFNEAHMHNTIV